MTNIHAGHKERLRAKALKNIHSLADHEVLELLLNFGIVRQNTNEIAHNLIKKYGTLSNVLDCDYETLCHEKGLGYVSACLLTLIPKIISRYTQSRIVKFNKIENIEQASIVFQMLLRPLDHEELYAICIDKFDNIIAIEKIAEGLKDEITVTTKTTIKGILKHNPNKVIIGHNHLTNSCKPSSADLIFTKELKQVLDILQIQLVEHLIICQNDEYFCMLKGM